MSGFVFKAIGFLIVVGVIFFAGFFAGGSFATDAAEGSQQQQIEQCLPINTAQELTACVGESDGGSR
ncbi:hypothetical protein [Spelaeicoccus albus]|uniref:Uncharacterized protein n=2 Tax=Spelaeicoccus albus TaxID=1280376 RepID=A0A7Z0D1D7_9MICO|nr:hypothetical protein [Spelaeicoccus albus]NYI66087.1 hypothetical protein [Spelaeicoccus albus]